MSETLEGLREGFALLDAGEKEAFGDVVRRHFAPDAEIVEVVGTFRGPDEVLPYWESFVDAFTDNHTEFAHAIEADGAICLELVWTGTNTGTMRMPDGTEIPATGRTVTLPHAVVVRYEGDRVTYWRTYMDQVSFLQQIGLIPEMAQA
jgi:limonene-1,2-epoxide hydrolase